jgi:hypothetical protein
MVWLSVRVAGTVHLGCVHFHVSTFCCSNFILKKYRKSISESSRTPPQSPRELAQVLDSFRELSR